MTSKCTHTLGITLMQKLQMFRALIEKAKNLSNLAPETSLERS
jgi:hypothetical protein